MIERALLLDWESRIDCDLHEAPVGHKFTFSVERGTGEDRQVLVEGVDGALADAIESALSTLDALLAHARGEAP